MRLKGYLHLDEGAIKQGYEIEEFASLVKKDCKPYLNIIKKLPHPFVRMMKVPVSGMSKKVGPDDVDDFLANYKKTSMGENING